jgi:small GTP-binding protein
MDSVRVTLYKNAQRPTDGRDILVNRTVSREEMLELCSQSLSFPAKKIYSKTGALLTSFEGLADGSALYVSRGEAFQVKNVVSDQRTSNRRWMVTMLGAAAVGKSAITIRYAHNKFKGDYDPTIEDCFQKTTTIEGKTANLSILDTAGMEDYESLIDHWIEQKDAFVLVFSVQQPETVQKIREFHDKIMHHYDRKGKRMPVVVLAANKIDVPDRYVSSEQSKQLAAELKIPLFEVSAQSNTNIEEMFTHIVRELRMKDAPDPKPTTRRFCQLL